MDGIFKDFQFLIMDCKRLLDGNFKDRIIGRFKLYKLKKSIYKSIDDMVINVRDIRYFISMYNSTIDDIQIDNIDFIPAESIQFENLIVVKMREDRKIAIGYKDSLKESNHISISIGYDGINYFNGDKIIFKNDDGSMAYNGRDIKKKDIVDVVSDTLKLIFKQYIDMYIDIYL